jgi:putative NADH-flavin reductase
MTIKNIALIGANGTLGPSVLSALLAANTFKITILTRQSSQSTYPSSITVLSIPDDLPASSLIQALTGQDALITTFAGTNADLQIRLADAAATAGVKRFIPADFGSCDSSSARALELIPMYAGKKRVREHLQGLAERGELSWTSVVCGHFFDYGLKGELLSVDLGRRKMKVFDGGDGRWSASTLSRVGEAVVRVLQREEETRNKMLYVQSFCVSQNEVLRSLERATGETWKVEQVDSKTFIAEMKGVLDGEPSEEEKSRASEALVSVAGIIDGDWEGKKGFANGLLGLEGENLDQVVKRVVAEL